VRFLVAVPNRKSVKTESTVYNAALTSRDREIVNHDVASLVDKVQSGDLDPEDVLLAYSKKALGAHRKTNCLTEVMICKA